MKLYLATSPRNLYLSVVRDGLTSAGHDVVMPPDGATFRMTPVDEKTLNENTDSTVGNMFRAFSSSETYLLYERRFELMAGCGAVVLMLPAPCAAFLEAGWFIGQQRPGVIYAPDGHLAPDLSYKLFERTLAMQLDDYTYTPVYDTVDMVLNEIRLIEGRAKNVSRIMRSIGLVQR